MKAFLRENLPGPLRRVALRGRDAALDSLEWALGRRDPMIPPRRKVFVGAGDFRQIGNEFLGYFRDLCQLRPDECVLDVGCGIGRMAVPLTRYLSPQGRYEGFDIVEAHGAGGVSS